MVYKETVFMLARVLEPKWVVNSSWLTCSPNLQMMPGSLVVIPNPLPCFSETAGRQVELHALHKEKGSTEMLAYLVLLADQQRVKKMLGQGWVSAPTKNKEWFSEVCLQPSSWEVAAWRSVVRVQPQLHNKSRWAWAVWDQLRKKEKD